MTTIWHNPKCSKSREALKLLEEKGDSFEVFKYLDTPPIARRNYRFTQKTRGFGRGADANQRGCL